MAQRSTLGLIVLGLLTEEPMHVYRMQKLIERYGKDRVVNVRRRASLYQTIDRLTRLGLVEVLQRESTDSHPDRTVYAITDLGRETAERWLREMLRTTGGEFPEFVAALSVLVGLPPDIAREELETRAHALTAALAEVESTLKSAQVPPLFLLEEGYRRAVLTAELNWVRGVVEDLRQGRLTWDEPWRRAIAAALEPPEEKA
ncbi:PadR family transcriptional regulator [Nonomuraea pusilla]|uniref:PadR family transcriptional regulator n=1 Tax=Nonomuraea pusilla TaxID=46177 RepID=UPI00332D8F3C